MKRLREATIIRGMADLKSLVWTQLLPSIWEYNVNMKNEACRSTHLLRTIAAVPSERANQHRWFILANSWRTPSCLSEKPLKRTKDRNGQARNRRQGVGTVGFKSEGESKTCSLQQRSITLEMKLSQAQIWCSLLEKDWVLPLPWCTARHVTSLRKFCCEFNDAC